MNLSLIILLDRIEKKHAQLVTQKHISRVYICNFKPVMLQKLDSTPSYYSHSESHWLENTVLFYSTNLT